MYHCSPNLRQFLCAGFFFFVMFIFITHGVRKEGTFSLTHNSGEPM